MKNKIIIKRLVKEGLTYQKIGDLLGISRQRVHQIYKDYSSKAKKPTTKIPKNWSPNKNYNSIGLGKISGRDFLKEIVRKRDNHTCQICGLVWEDGCRKLDVHHLDENLEGEVGRKYKNCKNIDRQITLCHKCHLNLDHIRKKMMGKRLST